MTSRPDDAAEQPADAASEPAADASNDADARADAVAAPEPELEPVAIDRDDVEVRARLVPRYGRFMVLGAIVGAIGGWLWSRLGSSGPWLGSGPVIDTSAIVPFLVAVGALAGIVLGAVVAIVLDRLVGRRRRTLTAERTRHHRGDLDD